MQKQFDEILQKRMDRKDFLKHVGVGFAVLTGVAGLVKTLNPQSQQQANESKNTVALGYGASVYGGRPAASQKS